MTSTPVRKITAEVIKTPKFRGGFHTEWLNGDNGRGVEFELLSGAGLGNSLLTLVVTLPSGKVIDESINISELTTTWVTAVLNAQGKVSTDG